MGLFDKMKNTDVKVEEAKDVLGGSGPLDTDVYNCKIKLAYVDYSKGGAMSVNFDLETDTGRKLRSQQWVTSGDAKGNKNYYVDRNGKNQHLPGYVLVNDIAVLTTDTRLEDLEPEEKVISLYDFQAGKEVPQQKNVLTELIGQDITLAVEKQIVDKNVQDASGAYVPSGETREINEVVKAFHAEYGVTVGEAKMGLKEADFRDRWADKNRGNVRNKAKGAADGAQSGAPAAGQAAKPATSLFG
ncbi:hypothetical protein VPMG_00088 [Vibrio phage VBP32]|uniref:Single-stranded DNA-binding protein n=2 Tax=Stoningtonvirus VBP47 TaxID=2846606 RepID=M4SP41_9CAUD|nr:single strand DNA binding protein [Vibrio phage VBP47]YP_007676578.1 single strand DNA binding protein [Vibrio phage VBP32]AGH57065.1 hypothetical protein VPNG_00041 [Vibrio phage VBP47]AGH57227.1 hypothetical protein VPMG_00088 [Vibrio phage VBP32]